MRAGAAAVVARVAAILCVLQVAAAGARPVHRKGQSCWREQAAVVLSCTHGGRR